MSEVRKRVGGIVVDISPLRLDPGFRSLWISQFGSAIGRETTRLVLPLYVYLVTGSAAAIGVFAAMQVVPLVVLALVGGAVADAYDRRVVLLRSNLAMVATSVALVWTATSSTPLLPLILALGVVHTGITGLE